MEKEYEFRIKKNITHHSSHVNSAVRELQEMCNELSDRIEKLEQK